MKGNCLKDQFVDDLALLMGFFFDHENNVEYHQTGLLMGTRM